ncbi:hypothetical protein CJF30_00007443 [Rutstroemia sp. NJR-2017a BBW]|nr:hypothetical protein CJF30_00007443 [Rutstroemia sp. NJR-2017a BBW]
MPVPVTGIAVSGPKMQFERTYFHYPQWPVTSESETNEREPEIKLESDPDDPEPILSVHQEQIKYGNIDQPVPDYKIEINEVRNETRPNDYAEIRFTDVSSVTPDEGLGSNIAAVQASATTPDTIISSQQEETRGSPKKSCSDALVLNTTPDDPTSNRKNRDVAILIQSTRSGHIQTNTINNNSVHKQSKKQPKKQPEKQPKKQPEKQPEKQPKKQKRTPLPNGRGERRPSTTIMDVQGSLQVQTPTPASESQCQAGCTTAIAVSQGSFIASWSQLPSQAMNSAIIPRTDVRNKALEFSSKQGQHELGPQEYLRAMLSTAEAQQFHQISQSSRQTNSSSIMYKTTNAEALSRVTNQQQYAAYSRNILPRLTADFCNTNSQGYNIVPQYQPADLHPAIRVRNYPLPTAMQQHQTSIATHHDNPFQSVPNQRISAGEVRHTSESSTTLKNYIESLRQRASQSFVSGSSQEHVARIHAGGQPTPHNASQQKTQQQTAHITSISQQTSLSTHSQQDTQQTITSIPHFQTIQEHPSLLPQSSTTHPSFYFPTLGRFPRSGRVVDNPEEDSDGVCGNGSKKLILTVLNWS